MIYMLKRYVKTLFIFLIIILITTGCIKSKEIEENYNKLKSIKDINSYTLDLRIYGKLGDQKINEIVKIKNHKQDYEIISLNLSTEFTKNEATIIYIKDGKTYLKDIDGKYIETDETVIYSDPSIYLEGLKNINENSKEVKKIIEDSTYKIYNVIVNKNVVKKMIENTNIKDLEIEKDIFAEVYINSDGYVDRIIYEVQNLTINAKYFEINNSNIINISIE